MNFEIVRNATVRSERVGDGDGYRLRITVDGRLSHTFPPRSRESGMLYAMDTATIDAILSGGTYFFAADKKGDLQLVEYRRGDYKGFIHSDNAVRNLSERLGSEAPDAGPYSRGVSGLLNRHVTRRTNGFFLGGPADNFSLDIPELGEGGAFKNTLYYRWSPFSSNIQTSLMVERLVCLNGMVGMADAIAHSIPLINGWEDNLRVVATQLKPSINATLSERFASMSETRATVNQLMDADQLVVERMNRALRGEDASVDVGYLSRLHDHLDPKRHLSRFYRDSVFESGVEASQALGHMTQYDVFNILTEASTHAGGDDGQNDRAIQLLANRLVFDDLRTRRKLTPTVPQSQDSDPTRAFFARD